MNKTLSDLIRISNTVGTDSTLVQGGGGNTSAKTDDGRYMYIKASGTALKDMDAAKGYRRLNLQKVLKIVKDDELSAMQPAVREKEVVNRLMLCCRDEFSANTRPSVEAHLHALLDKYIIHLHPDVVGAYVNAKEGKSELFKLFSAEKRPVLWVPYVDPGLMLAKKIDKLVQDYKKQNNKSPQILFLEKHGLFVTANTAQSAIRIVKRVIRLCGKKLDHPKPKTPRKADPQNIKEAKFAIRQAIFKASGDHQCIAHYNDESIEGFMKERNISKMLAAGPLTPDELIYANGPAMYLKDTNPEKITSRLTRMIMSGKKIPLAYVVDKLGLFVAGNDKIRPTIRDIVKSSFFIRANAWRIGGISSLNKRQQDFINNWEAEAFRRKLSAGDSAGLIADKISLVTGAGSGLGRSIALGLAQAGSMVALADIDTEAAKQTARTISQTNPSASCCVIHCNVTSEPSVAGAYEKLIDRWGGLDILVNAAGVAPAYPLEQTDTDKWRFALEVNLTGYMLMAKYAAKIMIDQAMGGSIVNISSKSGIDASKNNSAYNATKAGELHLTRGWAMELGRHNIRVNSICPGNVFEGSKIWNRQYIKVCAKKYGIKPEQVIPYYVSKTMLKLEIKGRDIADSVIFLSSDMARRITAQTLVVDAGQAMVR